LHSPPSLFDSIGKNCENSTITNLRRMKRSGIPHRSARLEPHSCSSILVGLWGHQNPLDDYQFVPT